MPTGPSSHLCLNVRLWGTFNTSLQSLCPVHLKLKLKSLPLQSETSLTVPIPIHFTFIYL